MDLKNYGFRTDNIQKSIVPYTLLFFSFAPFLLLFKYYQTPLINLYRSFYPIFYLSILGSIAQEVFFRGWLIYKLKRWYTSAVVVIFIDALLFSLMHLFLPLRSIFVPVSFIIGIGFATVYYYYPNIYLASLVHILINLVVPFGCLVGLMSC